MSRKTNVCVITLIDKQNDIYDISYKVIEDCSLYIETENLEDLPASLIKRSKQHDILKESYHIDNIDDINDNSYLDENGSFEEIFYYVAPCISKQELYGIKDINNFLNINNYIISNEITLQLV